MKKSCFYISIICILCMSFQLYAQNDTFPLWKGNIPDAIKADDYKEETVYKDGELTKVSRVSQPTLTVYSPAKPNGTAVLILPGGGYAHLSMYKEGKKVAQWLNSLGITAFVLKYRLPNDTIMKDKSIAPLQDAQEAIREIKRNATKWNIKPDRVGVIGFSAGGHLAASLSNRFAENTYAVTDTTSARPDFALLIYPVISMQNDIAHKGSQRNLLGENPSTEAITKHSNENAVNAACPPTFLVHAADDKSVPVVHTQLYYKALQQHNIPAEIHIYETGGHGFGLGNDVANSKWPEACRQWLRLHNWIQ